MRYLVLNDPHLDIYAPSSRRTDDYLQTCRLKLEAIEALCEAHQVAALVCTGDWFHKKNPQGVPHRLVSMLVTWSHRVTDRLGLPILTVLGNHDVQFNDFSAASIAKQPVSVLLANPKVLRVDLQPTTLDGVTFVGASYRPSVLQADGTAEEDRSQFVVPDLPGPLVQVTHASVVPASVMWSHLLASEVAQISRATICHTGHIHEDLGVHAYAREDGSTFWWTNVGSMTRGSLTEETIARQPKVLLVELEPGSPPAFTELVLPHPPAEQIYDVEGYREVKVRNREFSTWTAQLQRELHATTSDETSLEALVHQSLLDPAARDLALRLLNDAGA